MDIQGDGQNIVEGAGMFKRIDRKKLREQGRSRRWTGRS